MLLDTHALLWLLADDARLGPSARAALTASPVVHTSAASLWEIAVKTELGKLEAPDDLPDRIDAAGVAWLPVGPHHAWAVRAVTGLPHRDPFDRLLLAQAHTERLRFLTADRLILEATLAPEVRRIDARD